MDHAHGRTPSDPPEASPETDDARPVHPELPDLLRRASQGDEDAWRAIVDLYARRVYALARSRFGGRGGTGRTGRSARTGSNPMDQANDPAEEITQSVFVTVASKLGAGEYTEQGRFESWLFRVAMNRVRDEIRRLKRHAEPTDPEVFSGVADARDQIGSIVQDSERDDSLRVLRIAIDQLSESDREIVELRHHAGLSFKQMSDILNEPIGTLLARHHRALKKLKDLITAAKPSLSPSNT